MHSGLTMPSNYRKAADMKESNYSTTPRRWVCHREELDEETYRPRSTGRQYHCNSCSCSDDILSTTQCTNSLRRIQLEGGLLPDKWSYASPSGRPGRQFRRDFEVEYSTRSVSRGLPRDQPIRGRFFEEREEVDRFGRLPPVKRPITTRPIRTSIYDDQIKDIDDITDEGEAEEDSVDIDYSEESSDIQEAPYYSSNSRLYNARPRGQADSRRNNITSMGNRDTSVIRL